MEEVRPLVEQIEPVTLERLAAAAKIRCSDSEALARQRCYSAAIYLAGYVAEAILEHECLRAIGVTVTQNVELDYLKRRILDAKRHSIRWRHQHFPPGWAAYLKHLHEQKRRLDAGRRRLLAISIDKADTVWRHWRVELRYSPVEATMDQWLEAGNAARWFVEHLGRL